MDAAAETRRLRQHLLLARILGPHGLKGECRIQVLTDRDDGLASVDRCLLLESDEAVSGSPATITNVRGSDGALIALAGIETREEAAELKGYYLAVTREQSYATGDDRWFIADLIGCQVYDETRGHLGVVTEVIQGNANDNLTIRRPGGQRDLLVPILKTVLRSVDVEQATIHLTLPEGLWEIYEG